MERIQTLLTSVEELEELILPLKRLEEVTAVQYQPVITLVQSLHKEIGIVGTLAELAESENASNFKVFTQRFHAALLDVQVVAPKVKAAVTPVSQKKRVGKKFTMKGYLKKRGRNSLLKWQRRYFKKDRDKLFYFLDQEDFKSIDFIDLSIMKNAELNVPEGTEPGDTLRFFINLPNRQYHLEATSHKLARLWVKSLNDWKSRATQMTQLTSEDGASSSSTKTSSVLTREYETFEKLKVTEREDLEKALEAQEETVVNRLTKKEQRQEERRLERMRREAERQRREVEIQNEPQQPEASSEDISSSASLSTSPTGRPTLETRPSRTVLGSRKDSSEGATSSPEEGLDVPSETPVETLLDTPESRAEHEKKLKDQLSTLSNTHVQRSAQLDALQKRVAAVKAETSSLMETEDYLKETARRGEELEQQLQLLNGALGWGYQRARGQVSLQSMSLTMKYKERIAFRERLIEERDLLQLKFQKLQSLSEEQNRRTAAAKERWTAVSSPPPTSSKQVASYQQALMKDYQRQKIARNAHQIQNELLVFQKDEKDHEYAKKVEALESSTALYRALVESKQARLQRLRGQVLNSRPSTTTMYSGKGVNGGVGTAHDVPSDSVDEMIDASVERLTAPQLEASEGWGSLEDLPEQINLLRSAYFQALALSVKLSVSQHEDEVPSVTVDGLWEEVEADSIPWRNWPRWLTKRFQESLSPPPEPIPATPLTSTPGRPGSSTQPTGSPAQRNTYNSPLYSPSPQTPTSPASPYSPGGRPKKKRPKKPRIVEF